MTSIDVQLRSTAPPAGGPPALSGEDVAYWVHDAPVGPLVLAVGADGLLACSYASPDAVAARLARTVSPRVLRRAAPLDEARRALDAYFAGQRHDLALRVDLALATPFQRSVLGALAGVAYGTTTTYGALAARLGRPTASRAVGAALGANPLCVVLPCHRVVASSGALTGYAGGLAAKERLLALEGVRPAR
jgi:methylated-DNA-[protein]-cysteine S-methyltransferase